MHGQNHIKIIMVIDNRIANIDCVVIIISIIIIIIIIIYLVFTNFLIGSQV